MEDVQLSPDGRWIALQISRADLAADRESSVVAIISADGVGSPRVITPVGTQDSSPRWPPDAAAGT